MVVMGCGLEEEDDNPPGVVMGAAVIEADGNAAAAAAEEGTLGAAKEAGAVITEAGIWGCAPRRGPALETMLLLDDRPPKMLGRTASVARALTPATSAATARAFSTAAAATAALRVSSASRILACTSSTIFRGGADGSVAGGSASAVAVAVAAAVLVKVGAREAALNCCVAKVDMGRVLEAANDDGGGGFCLIGRLELF